MQSTMVEHEAEGSQKMALNKLWDLDEVEQI